MTKICPECKTEFEANHPNRKYCTDECKDTVKARQNACRWKLVRNKRAKRKKMIYEKSCTECGIMFTSRSHRKEVCSGTCHQRRRRRLRKELKLGERESKINKTTRAKRGTDPIAVALLAKIGKPKSYIDKLCSGALPDTREPIWQ